jgi:acetoin utilization protein AcuB
MKVKQPTLIERRMKFMPCTVEPSDSVAHARALLDERRINHLPVVCEGHLVGIVSSRDLRASAPSAKHPMIDIALELHPECVRVRTVMTTKVLTATPKDELSHAMHLMRRQHIGALPIVEQGRLAGIINLTDITNDFPSLHPASGRCKSMRRSGQRKRMNFGVKRSPASSR